MENKKEGKKLNLQKIKIAKLNRNGLRRIIGGDTEIGVGLSATECHTDTCPDHTDTCLTDGCGPLYGSNNNCRSNERFCVGN